MLNRAARAVQAHPEDGELAFLRKHFGMNE
jgi:hypothetical protein